MTKDGPNFEPVAYFITFHTYGTWLDGDAPGSVDSGHNEFGTPWLKPDVDRRAQARMKMAQQPFYLDQPRRLIVRDAIVAECKFRGWLLHALHVRTNHVHMVVTAPSDPEFVMRVCKSHASKCLTQAGFDNADRKRWAQHGSTRYLWREAAVAEKVDYTLRQQGDAMETYERDKVSESERG